MQGVKVVRLARVQQADSGLSECAYGSRREFAVVKIPNRQCWETGCESGCGVQRTDFDYGRRGLG